MIEHVLEGFRMKKIIVTITLFLLVNSSTFAICFENISGNYHRVEKVEGKDIIENIELSTNKCSLFIVGVTETAASPIYVDIDNSWNYYGGDLRKAIVVNDNQIDVFLSTSIDDRNEDMSILLTPSKDVDHLSFQKSINGDVEVLRILENGAYKLIDTYKKGWNDDAYNANYDFLDQQG